MPYLKLSVPEASLEGLIDTVSLMEEMQRNPLEARLYRKEKVFEGLIPHVIGKEMRYATIQAEYETNRLRITLGKGYALAEFSLGIGEKETLDLATTLYIQYRSEGLQISSVCTESVMEKKSSPQKALSPYDPEKLITPLWIAYRLGVYPSATTTSKTTEMISRIFERSSLQPVIKNNNIALYRTRDFIDEDFSSCGKSAIEILTNPDVKAHDPEELIGTVEVARELGVTIQTARRFLVSSGAIPVIKRKKAIFYRRGDVQDTLYLPGWLEVPHSVELPLAQYHPEFLVSDLWILYRLGVHPRDYQKITETRRTIFDREGLVPRFLMGGGKCGYYRAGDFQDSDFVSFGLSAREVLTNPYICERDPQEYISEIKVACELGIARKHAGENLRGLAIKPIFHKNRRTPLYRRGDVHLKLSLPGWLSSDQPNKP